MWNPKESLAIQLWKSIDQGHPKHPSGIPKPIPFYPIWRNDASKSIEKEKFINSGISKYLEFSQQHNLGFATCLYNYVLVRKDILVINELLNPCHFTHLVAKDV
jgi:hypothetical protein